MTLTEYINKLKIEEAKYVLDSSNASVTEAALSVGYNDPDYLSKVFTKADGYARLSYRQAETLWK